MDLLNHFSRLRRRPVRYWQSIRSPSLAEVNPQVEESHENIYPMSENAKNKVVILDKTEQGSNDASMYFREDEEVRFLEKKKWLSKCCEVCFPVKPEKSLHEFLSIKERYEKIWEI